jgi:hypothetical protein
MDHFPSYPRSVEPCSRHAGPSGASGSRASRLFCSVTIGRRQGRGQACAKSERFPWVPGWAAPGSWKTGRGRFLPGRGLLTSTMPVWGARRRAVASGPASSGKRRSVKLASCLRTPLALPAPAAELTPAPTAAGLRASAAFPSKTLRNGRAAAAAAAAPISTTPSPKPSLRAPTSPSSPPDSTRCLSSCPSFRLRRVSPSILHSFVQHCIPNTSSDLVSGTWLPIRLLSRVHPTLRVQARKILIGVRKKYSQHHNTATSSELPPTWSFRDRKAAFQQSSATYERERAVPLIPTSTCRKETPRHVVHRSISSRHSSHQT